MKNRKTNTMSMCRQLAENLQHCIVTAKIHPGNQLPTVDTLMQEYNVGRSIVQMAVAKLKDRGFIRSEGRRGMFVDEHPPHLYRFGILMPHLPEYAGWLGFNQAMVHEAIRLAGNGSGYRFEFYYGLNLRDGGGDLKRLLDDVEQQTLAGLMVVSQCEHVLEEQVIRQSGIAVVHLFGFRNTKRQPSISGMAEADMLKQVLPRFQELHAQRIAVMDLSHHPHQDIHEKIQAYGLSSKQSWMQYVSRDFLNAARRITWLWFELSRIQRPDGLLILDDNLLEHVLAGLEDMGVKPGKDVQIISRTNWPVEHLAQRSVHRFGFHAGQILVTSCRTLQALKRGEQVPAYQAMPFWFDDQVPKSIDLPLGVETA
jgi:hypothetical protein